MDDSTKRYILDVVENLNLLPNKRAELYEHIRKYVITNKRPYRQLLGGTKASYTDTPETIGEL